MRVAERIEPTGRDSREEHASGEAPPVVFADALGDRQASFDEARGAWLEVLRFKPEFGDAPGFEDALRASVEALGRMRNPVLHSVREVCRVGSDDRLALVSERPEGQRLADLMADPQRIALAVAVVQEVGPILAELHQHDHVHGALTPERIVVTPEGRPVVVEYALGAAIASLPLPGSRLRSIAGVAVRNGHDWPKCDPRLDLVQLGLIVLSLLQGRRLSPYDYPDRIPERLDLLSRSESKIAARFRPWLERTLQLGDRAFTTALDALVAFEGIARASKTAPVARVEDDRRPRPPASVSGPPTAREGARASMAAPEPARPSAPEPAPEPARVPAPASVPESAPAPPAGRHTTLFESVRSAAPPSAPATAESVKPDSRRAVILLALVVLAQSVVIAYQYVASLSVEAPTVVVNGSALVAAAEPPPVPAPDATDASATPGGEAVPLVGGVTLTAPVELQVFKDGELLGATGSPLALPVGTHVLDVVNEALGYSGRQRVDVQSGQMSAIAVRVPRGRVSINAVPWADVLIDGAEAGQTPLANLSLTIGEHEIVFRHPELGEQRQVAVVTADGVTRVSAVFRQ